MIGTLLTIYGTAASALGGYNVSRFLAQRAVKLRRARKAERTRDEKLNRAVEYGEGLIKRFQEGNLDLAKVRQVLDVMENAKTYVPPVTK